MRMPIAWILLLAAAEVLAQPSFSMHAYLSCEGPFTARCDGSGGLLSDETMVFVLRDMNEMGPDSLDLPPCPSGVYGVGCYMEDPMSSFLQFYLSGEGGFLSPLFGFMPGMMGGNRLYLLIFNGENREYSWTSPVFDMTENTPPDTIHLPFAEWMCGPAPVAPFGCMGSHASLEMNMADTPPRVSCVTTCYVVQLILLVRLMDERSGLSRPPVVQLDAGCDTCNERPASFRTTPARWDYLEFIPWWDGCIFTGESRGCITVTLLDSIPAGRLDTLAAAETTEGIRLTWNTLREEGLAGFEIWCGPTLAGHQSELQGYVPAMNSPSGGTYEFLHMVSDSNPRLYTLAMRDLAGHSFTAARIPARRGYLTASPAEKPAPDAFTLFPVSPNPFNATARIRFELSSPSEISLRVFDILGREVAVLAEGMMFPGEHHLLFDGGGLPSGVYVCRFAVNGRMQNQKMILLR